MKKTFIALLVTTTLILSSCDILQQVGEMANFAKCEFRLSTVDNLRLAGVDVQNKNSISDLNFADAARLATAFASGNMPLNMTLNVQVKNPNPAQASLNRLDWIMLIDDVEMVRGVNQQTVSVSPNGGVSTLPLQISVDLREVLSGKSKDAVLNFGLNLAGAGNRPTRITLRAKPSLKVANQMLSYPGYITVENEFSAN